MPAKTKKLKASKKNANIIREKVYVDDKKVDINCIHLHNKAAYAVFKSDMDPSEPLEDNIKSSLKPIKSVCFAGLLNKLIDAVSTPKHVRNRLYDKVDLMHPKAVRESQVNALLTPEECSEWILLAKKYNLLPPYINENAITKNPEPEDKHRCHSEEYADFTGEFIIDLEGLSPAVLYIYLSTLRNMREDPGFPRAVMYLVNDLGMNFYAAYVFASNLVLNSTGHHTISVQRPYGLVKTRYDEKRREYVPVSPCTINQIVEDLSIPINFAIGLQRVVNSDPLTYDKRELGEKRRSGFECNSTIERASKVRVQLTFQELFDEDVVAAIMSKTDGDARRHLGKFNEKKSRIIYKEAGK